jgi:hypothetical protein
MTAHRRQQDRASAPAKAAATAVKRLLQNEMCCWVMYGIYLITQHIQFDSLCTRRKGLACVTGLQAARDGELVSDRHHKVLANITLCAHMSLKQPTPRMHIVDATHHRYASSMSSGLSRLAASAGSGIMTAAGGTATAATGGAAASGAAAAAAAAGGAAGAAACSPAPLPVLAASCVSPQHTEVTWRCISYILHIGYGQAAAGCCDVH